MLITHRKLKAIHTGHKIPTQDQLVNPSSFKPILRTVRILTQFPQKKYYIDVTMLENDWH
jgi:hypothetical protein